jgi:phage terminase large subunit
MYETGLTNDVLATQLKDKISKDRVACDSAEPKSIAELQNFGIDAYPVKKGKDSVNFGIDWLKQQVIIIDTSCINTRNEFQQYKWKEDAGGHALKIPVDKNNHLMDALRYAYEDDMDMGSFILFGA